MSVYEHIETAIEAAITAEYSGVYDFLETFDLDNWQSFQMPYIYQSISEYRSDGESREDSGSSAPTINVRLFVGSGVKLGTSGGIKKEHYDKLEALDIALTGLQIATLTTSNYVNSFDPVIINVLQPNSFNKDNKVLFDILLSIPTHRKKI
ncbi:MAG: hypothetical protein GY853_14620 [PVC group bacterium]|nr:hypothetical protein [PVC group bacterium]